MPLASTSLLLNSAREIKFKVRKRVARVARFMRFHCCGCNLILEFRNKKTATELRHRRDFDLALQLREGLEGLCDRWSMQQLDRPRNCNVVSNVANEVMRNRQNRATGTSEIAP